MIRATARRYGVNEELALSIAKCESGLRADAKNRSSSASGVFQFLASTWANQPEGKAGKSVFEVQANIETAVRLLSYPAVGTAPWNASRYCWER